MNEERYTLRRWMTIGVPVLTLIAISAAEFVHLSYGIGWDQLVGALFVALGVQISWYISMFWVRKSYLVTRDSRLGIVVCGAYLLGIVLTLDYYLLRWKIVNTNRLGDDAVQIPIYTAALVILFSLWQRHHPPRDTKDTSSH